MNSDPTPPAVDISPPSESDGPSAGGLTASFGTSETAERRVDLLGTALVTSAIAVLVIAARDVLEIANSDAILPVLMSTQDLTLFYWGQDRLANLVPAIAMPIRPEWWNFATQMTIIAVGFFSMIACFAGYHLLHTGRGTTDRRLQAVTILLSGLLTLWLLDDIATYHFVFEQLYATCLVLTALGATLLVRGGRFAMATGVLMLFAAVMVNPSCLLYAPIAWLVQSADDSWRSRRPWLVVATLLASDGIVTALSRTVTYSNRSLYNTFSVSAMTANFGDALSSVWHEVAAWPTTIALIGAAAVLVTRRRRLSLRAKIAYAFTPIYGLVWTFVFSGNAWVEANLLHPRYFFPLHAACILVLTGAITELLAMGAELLRLRSHQFAPVTPLAMAATVAVIVTVVAATVWQVERVTPDVVLATRVSADAAEQFDAPIIVGDYWTVWPAVVEARSRGLDVNGLSMRSEPVMDSITSAIDQRLRADEPLVVVCITPDAPTCVEELSWRTSISWTLDGHLNDTPLVIAVVPGSD